MKHGVFAVGELSDESPTLSWRHAVFKRRAQTHEVECHGLPVPPIGVRRVLRGVCESSGATYDFTYLWRYPVTSNDAEQTRYVKALAQQTVGADCAGIVQSGLEDPHEKLGPVSDSAAVFALRHDRHAMITNVSADQYLVARAGAAGGDFDRSLDDA